MTFLGLIRLSCNMLKMFFSLMPGELESMYPSMNAMMEVTRVILKNFMPTPVLPLVD